MITVLAFTQLAFLSLGVATLLVRERSSGNLTHPPLTDFLLRHWPWLYAIAIGWIAYGLLSQRLNRTPFWLPVARGLGVFFAVAFFAFFATTTYIRY